ncbi:MAG: hypothetical protein ACXWLH_02580 [Candidatus Saccharimonadales bacterium]
MKWFDKDEFKNTKLSDYMKSGTFTGEARERVIKYTKIRTIFSLVIIAVVVIVAISHVSGSKGYVLPLILLAILFAANVTYQIATKSTIFQIFSLQTKQNKQAHQANEQELNKSADDLRQKNNDGDH